MRITFSEPDVINHRETQRMDSMVVVAESRVNLRTG
jgi:hypothetical protein